MKTLQTILIGLCLLTSGLLLATPAQASVCDNQSFPEDISILGIVGVDTGINDGNGTSVCVGSASIGADGDDPPDGGYGLVVEVFSCTNIAPPCFRIIEYTGASVNSGPGTLTIYVYLNGIPFTLPIAEDNDHED